MLLLFTISVAEWGATNTPTAPHETPRHPMSLNYIIVCINYLTKLLQGISFMYQKLVFILVSDINLISSTYLSA